MARSPRRRSTSAAQKVTVRPVDPALARDLARVERLARMLDTRFSVAGVRFGWDTIIGLVPAVGDLATAGLALYPVYLAHRHGLGMGTMVRMLGNVGVDALVGTVPVAGDLFDVAFKANKRNLELFRKAVGRKRGI